MIVQELIASLGNEESYQRWKQQHPHSYCSHLFCQLCADGRLKGTWEIGFFDPDQNKITVFAQQERGFEIKPPDEVFRKEQGQIEALHINEHIIPVTEAVDIGREILCTHFSHEPLGDGFVVLQKLQHKPLWNITFVTKTLRFLNVKVHAEEGTVDSYDLVKVIQRDGEKE